MSPRRTKVLWVRADALREILSGRKTIEVRVAYDNVGRLRAGDRLRLNDEHVYEIRRIGRYAGFEELLAKEDVELISPGSDGLTLLARCRDIYPPEKEALGVVALEIAPASEPVTEKEVRL